MGYSYYDTPDGKDCDQKLFYITKHAGALGIVVSTFDVLMHSKPQGYLATLGRYGYICGPFIGMAAAFSITTCMATTIRQKDDKLNSLMGGVVTGSLFGMWQKCFMSGLVGTLAFSGIAVLKKLSLEEGWELWPTQLPKKVDRSLMGTNLDWTIVKDVPSKWTK